MKKGSVIAVVIAGILLVVAGVFVGARLDMGKGQLSSRIVGFPQSFADLSAKISPAVVNISTTTTVRVPGNPFRHFFGPDDEGPFGDFFRKYDGDIPDREMKQQSLGSGFIFDKSGFIITNNHVVEKADEIKVKLADGREFTAKVVGRDPKTDLALIKISSLFKDLPTLPLGDSDKMRVGDWVLAIGNPFGLEHTVTQGIISAKGRVIGSGPYDNFIQTDAPINPGNSGGPLVNLHGEVIGINSAIIASGQGIGFAIPSDMAKTVISQLKERGKVVRGWIGVSIQSLTPELAQSLGMKQTEGALVGDVVPGGPAEAAGIRRGDVIVSFNGNPVRNVSSLSRAVAETGVGRTVEVRVAREGKELPLRITVQEMTEERMSPRAFLPRSELGITVENITPPLAHQLKLRDRNGVVVTDVESGSPAESAGIQPGDVIREVNRVPVKDLNEYQSVLAKTKKGAPVLFLIRRGEQTFYLSIRLS
ncbi:MAG: DegQ family serine endoprotease [Thermodesulfovibrionales bacterium]